MSKWEELEKAAKAATPGPWGHEEIDPTDPEWGASEVFTEGSDNYVATHVCSVKDAAYIAAANPSAILELLAELDALKAELEGWKQAAKTWENEAERRSDRYVKCAAELDRIRAMEPVAWRTFDGEGGYDYRTYDMNEDYAEDYAKRNPKYAHWVEPLITLEKP